MPNQKINDQDYRLPIYIFTDGSSFISKDGRFYEASSACSIYIMGLNVLDLGVYHKDGTNSLGELYAIMLGLDRLYDIMEENPELKNSTITVVSDSGYVISSLNSYIFSWIKQGMKSVWKTSSGTPVSYQNMFKSIWKEYRDNGRYQMFGCPISFLHMRGHINEKITKDKAYEKFKKKNNMQISEYEFSEFIDHNHHVDKLADMIRVKKVPYYERRYGNLWVKKERKVNTKRNQIVILPRSKKRN